MMVIKEEQERIKTLLRDTITLLCRNGLTFKNEFSIEALIGITLDKDDVVLVSINEQINSGVQQYEESSGDAQENCDRQEVGYQDGYSPGYSPGRGGGDRGRRRRRRKRSFIKSEVTVSDEEESIYRGASSLLDLSAASYAAARGHHKDVERPPTKKTCTDDASIQSTNHHDDRSVEPSDEQHSDDTSEKTMEHAVIVKKEFTDESWPPAGVMQEVIIGGSDTNSESSHPGYNAATAAGKSLLKASYKNMYQYRGQDGLVNPAMVSPSSSPRHPHLAGIPPMMNGIPFPAMSLPQTHFAQALGRLVGSMPPTLPQHMPHTPSRGGAETTTPSKTSAASASASSGTSPNLYQPSTRTSLPKEAVALMSEWLRKNQHNPYPTDDIKDELVRATNLTYNQINYWFTNARRRLLPKWELQRKIEEQQLAERMSQRGGDDRGHHGDDKVWAPPEMDRSSHAMEDSKAWASEIDHHLAERSSQHSSHSNKDWAPAETDDSNKS